MPHSSDEAAGRARPERASLTLSDPQGNVMALDFLNNCRSFDTERKTLSFWGSDVMSEVAFRLDESALHRLTGLPHFSEDVALAVFDINRTDIRNAARRAYKKASMGYCELSADDL
jgi:hypothetical protein